MKIFSGRYYTMMDFLMFVFDKIIDRIKRQHLAENCLWKPKPEAMWHEDSVGRYFFDEEHYKKVIEAKKFNRGK